ncbi:MAG TPA: glycosyl hydrolase family 28-related protein, partial [Gammaproteobacteria bacterium]|nr:glycosyl hydrolase family 28-related protein [Gammaproteobacteria bacterium]
MKGVWMQHPLYLGVLLVALRCSATADIIPAGRIPPWNSNIGVPNGIPLNRPIHVNVVDLGADPTGIDDSSPIIQSAIDNCPQGQVVYIPEGTFRLGTLLHVQNNQGITVRGAGIGRTTLFGPNNNPIFTAGDATWPPPEEDSANWISITSGATKGSSTITVANSARFVVGAPMAIAPNPLPVWAHNLDGFPDTLRSMRVYLKVRSKTGTTVTFDPP